MKRTHGGEAVNKNYSRERKSGLVRGRSTLFEHTCNEFYMMTRHLEKAGEASKRDEDLRRVFDEWMQNTNFVALDVLDVELGARFLKQTYSHQLVMELGRRESKFLTRFANNWGRNRANTYSDWAKMLYLYCGKACNLFGLLFAMNRNVMGGTDSDVGRVLLEDLPNEFGKEATFAVQSALGFIVRYVTKNVMVRVHEQDIYNLTKHYAPRKVGEAVRQLLLYRSRPDTCTCGWFRTQALCTCELNMDFDPLKEYALALFICIGARRSGVFDEFDRRHGVPVNKDGVVHDWKDAEKAEFVSAACEELFARVSFEEICTTLKLSGEGAVEPQLKRVRLLSDRETLANYDGSFAQHSGCIQRGCKVIPSFSCPNFACGTHCQQGYFNCKTHNYKGCHLPNDGGLCHPRGWKRLFSTEAGRAACNSVVEAAEWPSDRQLGKGYWDWN